MIDNLEHSVRDRLNNLARNTGRPFQEILQFYGLERFLYRLSRSAYSEDFVLKGALLLRAWKAEASRPTRDIDLLGHVENDVSVLTDIVREVCRIRVESDGIEFDPTTVAAQPIKSQEDSPGVRILFRGCLGRALIPMQIDVGFGDVVHPAARRLTYPVLLAFPAPTLRTYPRETVIAEKLEAIVSLGTANSRMKDFYDIWLLSRQFDFEGRVLAEAISKTFARRETPLAEQPVGLTETFTRSEGVRGPWAAFLRKSSLESAPPRLDEIREPLRAFLFPVIEALVEGRTFDVRWSAAGPWRGVGS